MSEDQRARKSAVVADVKERFEEADAVLVTEYRGLDVGQMADLRRALRAAETVYKIYKNTLVRRALAEGAPERLDRHAPGFVRFEYREHPRIRRRVVHDDDVATPKHRAVPVEPVA